MNGNTTRSDMVTSGNDSLELITGYRTEPEYTMQAVAQRTGVPPDTLRSWERRHGFPSPARNDSNRRLYSERDIAAVRWLREQTERGQGTSEAVHMLLSRIRSGDEPVRRIESGAKQSTPVLRLPDVPLLDSFQDALATGRMPDAQRAWDQIALVVSPDALTSDVILSTCHRLRSGDIPHHIESQAVAFLERKTTVLLDQAGPDRGTRSVCIVNGGGHRGTLAAIVLANALSRSGFRLYLPVLDVADIAAVDTVKQVSPETVIFVSDDGAASTAMRTFARMVPDKRLYGWSSRGDVSFPDPIGLLPASLLDIASALQ